MSMRSEFMRNVRILALISVCFTTGVFVAEYVGNSLQSEAVEASSSSNQPVPAPPPSASGETTATQTPEAEIATLPDAAKHTP